MTDPIRDALERLSDQLLPTLFSKGVDAAFLQSWASHARAALATRPPADDDDDRAALQGLLDRMHLAATDPAAWLGLKQGEDQSPADAPPPAPAPVDIDALLSPEGAYERGGTGQEPGAQQVSGPNGPEWWVSQHGCETLDNLLDRLRARILPYLRPPIVGIDVPGPDGDYGDVMDLCAAEGVDPRVGVPLLKRAREAWAAALLRQPAPAPAVVPVPVANRLPQAEDCSFNPGAAIGSCWCWNPPTYESDSGWWSFEPLEWAEDATHWLPAYAIPQPPQGEEVA